MNERDCRRILQVDDRAALDDVKRSYRRLAFALHPDLNPDKPDAARRFRQLNEAYVLLTRLYEERGASQSRKAGAPAGGTAGTRSGTRPDARGDGKGRPAHRDTTAPPGQGTRATSGGARPSAGPTSGDARRSGTTAGESGWEARQGSRPDAETRERAETGAGRGSGEGSSPGDNGQGGGADRTKRKAQEAYAEREDVLQDILRDPFARRVFEDIYSQIRRTGGTTAERPPKKRKLSLEWGDRSVAFDFTHGVAGAVSGWLRRQIDEEQTIHLPAANLLPGGRVRLQIRQGLSDEVRTVEMTLPPDFVVGRPLRLKGLGKRIGPWQGDLYLRLLAKV